VNHDVLLAAFCDLSSFEKWQIGFGIGTLVVGIAGLCAVLRYVFVTTQQWNEAKKANELAAKHHELSSRAWLLATGTSIGPLVPGTNKVTVTIEHLGKVPALDIKISCAYGWGVSFPQVWQGWGPFGGPFVEGAKAALGGEKALIQPYITIAFREGEFERAKSGELWLRCRIDYSDCFRRRNPTIAYWRYKHATGRWATVSQDVDQEPPEEEWVKSKP
jgi:hypothetical protein